MPSENNGLATWAKIAIGGGALVIVGIILWPIVKTIRALGGAAEELGEAVEDVAGLVRDIVGGIVSALETVGRGGSCPEPIAPIHLTPQGGLKHTAYRWVSIAAGIGLLASRKGVSPETAWRAMGWKDTDLLAARRDLARKLYLVDRGGGGIINGPTHFLPDQWIRYYEQDQPRVYNDGALHYLVDVVADRCFTAEQVEGARQGLGPILMPV